MACRRRESAGNERQSRVKVDALACQQCLIAVAQEKQVIITHAHRHAQLGRRRELAREIWPNKKLQMNELSSAAAAPKSFEMQNRFELTQVGRLVDWLTDRVTCEYDPKGIPIPIRIRIRIQSSVKRLFTRFQSLFQQLVRLSYLWPTNLAEFGLLWPDFHLV